MADPWTAAWEEAEASAPPSLVVYDTLELQHEAFINEDDEQFPVRVVSGVSEDMDFTIELGATFNGGESVTFQAVMFQAERPEFSEAKAPECQVIVDGIGDEIVGYLEDAVYTRSDMKLIYRQYRSDDLTEPCFGPVEFIMKSVRMTGTQVIGTAKLEDLVNRKFPNIVYTYAEFPGLQNA